MYESLIFFVHLSPIGGLWLLSPLWSGCSLIHTPFSFSILSEGCCLVDWWSESIDKRELITHYSLKQNCIEFGKVQLFYYNYIEIMTTTYNKFSKMLLQILNYLKMCEISEEHVYCLPSSTNLAEKKTVFGVRNSKITFIKNSNSGFAFTDIILHLHFISLKNKKWLKLKLERFFSFEFIFSHKIR